MKKVIYSLIILSTLLLLFSLREKKDAILKIISLKNTNSLVMTNTEESIRIPIFINQKDTMYINKSNISNAFIKDKLDQNIMLIDILDISVDNQKIEYNGEDYFSYLIDFVPTVESEDLIFNIDDAILSINYENDFTIDLEIGLMNILFNDIDNKNHMSLNRLYGIINNVDAFNTTTGFVMSLENKTSSKIVIKDISFNIENVISNNKYVKNISEDYDNKELVQNILKTDFYQYVCESCIKEDLSLEIVRYTENKYFVPLIYTNEVEYLYKFPIIITYLYENELYEYVIDDFIFFNSGFYPSFMEERVVLYEISN